MRACSNAPALDELALPFMNSPKQRICWLTPDYFLDVDAHIVPLLARYYDIDWVLIHTHNTERHSDGLIFDDFKPRPYKLKYRQRDPRIIVDYWRLLLAIRRSNVDLVYVSFHGLPFFFPLAFLLLHRSKLIYGIHNVTTPSGAVNERAMRLYHRYVFRNIDQFHVFSKYQLRAISRLLPQKRHYYAPLPLENYGPSEATPPRDRIRFLFFGYIREYKRLDLLIKSFQAVRETEAGGVDLIIAGNCDNWSHYQTMITDSDGIETRIKVIPNRDIPDLLSSCHYVVLPYQDGAQSAVLNLAYHYNKPVIASDIEAFKDLVVEGITGFLFKSKSTDSLTAVMTAVTQQHKQAYHELQRNIREYVIKEQSTEQILAKYRLLLEECLAHQRRGGVGSARQCQNGHTALGL
jgi:glycosyltransferase involved in cell wall biosynthesis